MRNMQAGLGIWSALSLVNMRAGLTLSYRKLENRIKKKRVLYMIGM